MMNPVSTAINVVRAFDAELDAWRGGAMFVNKVISAGDLPDYSISRAAYEECGHHYLKEHSCSNYLYG
jgi:actin-related protein